MTIHVTAEDIAKGVKRKCLACPVARAIARTIGKEWVHVGPMLIDYGSGIRPTPIAAVQFIELFDAGLPVHPFTFELDIEP